ncbi:hypothetical protein Pst134EA_031567 [Puccinia striiformis f. sp. tritici]|uniref:Serine aminopeptidase S33 domain-containing protein n=1 Tax=Puccinia striiformis f. sp. tritici PST-78 TaxID=1165861 RepID=A0A0L0UUC3_9BASI|nr:uncharacterized protein Pst134EA_031567 [Puccinia striiformis f. sp. tritici]KAH9442750.1 hypothetical protein Pst134EA_031567 [Puccinia striiformis f. sp. tritici]KAH9444698.1 hypothetical protein Pst134EB_024954 [Puccinia striiformis f. sp. tritici]KNE90646.1 hypothetical protein PSTG_15909 [Puccinia striiformis f. sp. tritici PST-78]KNE90647.1 hypothetical protein, variant [Puccinia striiformis f. sp. tritici PST-78]
MTELSTSEAMKLIPSGPEQQAARESFLEKYSTAVPWPIPKEQEWYWKDTPRPVDSLPVLKSVFVHPFLERIGLRTNDDPTYGRYSLPFSPNEKLIRDDKRYTCWDGRIFLKERSDKQIAEPVEEKTSQWVWYQVWWDEEASKRTGVELDLLFCHGICEYGGAFAKNAKKFLDAGYRLIVPDFPSHGRSTGFHAHLTNLDCLAHTVHMVLGDVIKRDSVAGLAQRPVIVVGQSMGGFATVLYGLLYHSPTVKSRPTLTGLPQPKLLGLIPLCPMLAIAPDSRPAYLVELFARMVCGFAGRLALANANKGKNTPDSWFEAQFKLDPQSYTGDLRISTGLNILSALDFTNEHLADLIVPFQIMHGGSDRVTNPRGSIALYEQSKSTQKSIKIYPFVEHIMMRIGRDEEDDLPRQKILNDIIQWIDEIRAATPNP